MYKKEHNAHAPECKLGPLLTSEGPGNEARLLVYLVQQVVWHMACTYTRTFSVM